MDRAWKLVDSTKEKEERSRKIIQDLRQQVEQLNKIVDRSSDLSVGQENSVQDLIRKKEELKKENESKQEMIEGQKVQIEDLLQQIKKQDLGIQKLKGDIEQFKKDLKNAEDEKSR